MFRHIVLMKWKPETPGSVADALDDALAGLHRRTPSLLAYAYGPDAGSAAGTWDYAVVADFADESAYVEFRDDVDHQALIAEFIAPWREKRASVQLVLDPSTTEVDRESR